MAVPKRLRLLFDSICDGCLGGAVKICPMTGKWSESPAKKSGSESQAAQRQGQLNFAVYIRCIRVCIAAVMRVNPPGLSPWMRR